MCLGSQIFITFIWTSYWGHFKHAHRSVCTHHLGQCVFNATPPYLCCHTSLSSSFMTYLAFYIIIIHDALNLLYHHRSSSLSLSSQVSSYASALYQHQGAEQSPRYHPFKALYRQALQSPVTAGTPLKPCTGRHPKAQ